MPQFDFGHVFWPQVAWLAIIFAVLYFGVVRITLPKLGRVMDAREQSIAADLAAAKLAKETADTIDAQYHSDLNASREQARETIASAKAAAARSTEARLAEADGGANAAIIEAEARIAEAVAKAEGALVDVAADSAHAIVVKLTGTEPDRDAVRALVATRI